MESSTANEDGTKIVTVDVNPSPKDDPANQKIRHFRVPPGLCIKTRLSGQPLIWKWFFIFMQTHFDNKCARVGLTLKVRVFGTRKWPIAESPTGGTDFARRVTPETKNQPVNQKMTEIQVDFSKGFFEWDNSWVKRKASIGNIVEHPPTSAVGLYTAWELWNLRVRNGCQAGMVLLPFPLQKTSYVMMHL